MPNCDMHDAMFLEREIRCLRSGIENAIVTRREHPSYGYGKTGIRNNFYRLQGMIAAWLYVTRRSTSTAGPSFLMIPLYDEIRDGLGIDIINLQERVKNL